MHPGMLCMPCFIDTDLCQGAARLAPSTAIKQMPGWRFAALPSKTEEMKDYEQA